MFNNDVRSAQLHLCSLTISGLLYYEYVFMFINDVRSARLQVRVMLNNDIKSARIEDCVYVY